MPPSVAKTPRSRTRTLLVNSSTSLPLSPVRLRKLVDVGDENASADSHQNLKDGVEDYERHERDPAYPCRGALDPAQESVVPRLPAYFLMEAWAQNPKAWGGRGW